MSVHIASMALEDLQPLLAEQSHQRSQDSSEQAEMGKHECVRTWVDTEWDKLRIYLESSRIHDRVFTGNG
jgi:hypothetical protein